ncbi:cadherin-like domain-containing protein, partial [Rhodobacteraceae bacterium NNCM2]|nr:cadherin-like domain-containing protein [Coraliihabitans acroporae]
VDYFEVDSDPLAMEDGQSTDSPPVAGDDALETPVDTALTISIADLMANDSDPEGADLTFVGFTDPANGTLVDNGDGTLSYTPGSGYVGDDSFEYTISDGTTTVTTTVTLSVNAPAALSSDDFGGVALGLEWVLDGSAATADLGADGDERFLELGASAGNRDMWNINTGASKLMQSAADEDFTLEARFLSEPSQRFQMQGLLVEQDASNWIRFDV